MGKRKLKLAHPIQMREGPFGYEVIEVINSVDYVPGEILTKAAVTDLVSLGLYEIVTVKKRDHQ